MYICMYVWQLTQLAAGLQDEKRADDKQIERTKSSENCIAELKRPFLSLCALCVDKKPIDQ